MFKTNVLRFAPAAAVAAAALAATSAQAAIDTSAVTGGVSEIGVAMVAIIGALLAVSVLIMGIGKVYSFVKRKAGG